MKLLFTILLTGILFFSCETLEGEGGTSSISGKIFVKDYDTDGDLKDAYYPGEWPVYIIYGDDEIYGDKMDTHFDGGYKFTSLYPGQYTIFTYSKCASCPGGTEVISTDVTLDRSRALILEDLEVID